MSLKAKVAIVTGASSGIGAGIAEYFAKEGALLSLTGRKMENLEAVSKKCGSTDSVLATLGDLADHNTREILVKRTIEKFGKLDILINNAGIVHISSIRRQPEESFNEVMNINLKAPYFLTQVAIPHLIESKGSVVNISSISSFVPIPGYSVCGVAKSGLDNFTRTLSIELGSKGVRVNSISPGLIEGTDIVARSSMKMKDIEQMMSRFKETTPVGRNGRPEDVARAVAFLASDEASFITGQNLRVDGGILHVGG